MKYYIAACNYIVFRIFWKRLAGKKENPRRAEKRVDMKILTFTLGILFLLGSIQQAKANPVWYYMYSNPAPPDANDQYGSPTSNAGDRYVCVPYKNNQVLCGIRADLTIVIHGVYRDVPAQSRFVAWKRCYAYSQQIAAGNVNGFAFFCYGTDGRWFK